MLKAKDAQLEPQNTSFLASELRATKAAKAVDEIAAAAEEEAAAATAEEAAATELLKQRKQLERTAADLEEQFRSLQSTSAERDGRQQQRIQQLERELEDKCENDSKNQRSLRSTISELEIELTASQAEAAKRERASAVKAGQLHDDMNTAQADAKQRQQSLRERATELEAELADSAPQQLPCQQCSASAARVSELEADLITALDRLSAAASHAASAEKGQHVLQARFTELEEELERLKQKAAAAPSQPSVAQPPACSCSGLFGNLQQRLITLNTSGPAKVQLGAKANLLELLDQLHKAHTTEVHPEVNRNIPELGLWSAELNR